MTFFLDPVQKWKLYFKFLKYFFLLSSLNYSFLNYKHIYNEPRKLNYKIFLVDILRLLLFVCYRLVAFYSFGFYVVIY